MFKASLGYWMFELPSCSTHTWAPHMSPLIQFIHPIPKYPKQKTQEVLRNQIWTDPQTQLNKPPERRVTDSWLPQEALPLHGARQGSKCGKGRVGQRGLDGKKQIWWCNGVIIPDFDVFFALMLLDVHSISKFCASWPIWPIEYISTTIPPFQNQLEMWCWPTRSWFTMVHHPQNLPLSEVRPLKTCPPAGPLSSLKPNDLSPGPSVPRLLGHQVHQRRLTTRHLSSTKRRT